MIAEVVLNTTELATWFIGAVITAMCVLLYNLLRKLESNQEKHAEKLSEHSVTLASHDERIKNLE